MENNKQAGVRYAVLLLIIGIAIRNLTNVIAGGIIGGAVGIFKGAGMSAQEVEIAARKVVENNIQYLSLLGFVISSIVLILMGLRRKKETLKELVMNNKHKLTFELIKITAILAFSLALFSSEILGMVMSWLEISASSLRGMNRLLHGPIGILLGLVLAPIFEEIIFRGIILEKITKKYKARKALVISAGLFSVYHFNLFQLVPSFLLGLLLGYIYLETRSVILCIITHSLYNLIPVINIQLQTNIGKTPKIEIIDYVILTASLVALAAGFKLLRDYFKNQSNLRFKNKI